MAQRVPHISVDGLAPAKRLGPDVASTEILWRGVSGKLSAAWRGLHQASMAWRPYLTFTSGRGPLLNLYELGWRSHGQSLLLVDTSMTPPCGLAL